MATSRWDHRVGVLHGVLLHMFEQAFRNIDDALRKEAGCTTELDYTEQTSWLLFLKYLDGLEQDRADEAALSLFIDHYQAPLGGRKIRHVPLNAVRSGLAVRGAHPCPPDPQGHRHSVHRPLAGCRKHRSGAWGQRGRGDRGAPARCRRGRGWTGAD